MPFLSFLIVYLHAVVFFALELQSSFETAQFSPSQDFMTLFSVSISAHSGDLKDTESIFKHSAADINPQAPRKQATQLSGSRDAVCTGLSISGDVYSVQTACVVVALSTFRAHGCGAAPSFTEPTDY